MPGKTAQLTFERINLPYGFSAELKKGQHYWSQGMGRTPFGIAPNFRMTTRDDSAVLSGLTLANWFAQYPISVAAGDMRVLAYTSAGKLYSSSAGVSAFSLINTNAQTGSGNGLIVDQKGRALYMSDRYIGMSSDLTVFTDNWKDLGTAVTGFKDATRFEEWVVVAHGNKLAALNTNDDSINTSAFTMPTGFVIRCVKSNRTGILVGANVGNQGVLLLWSVGETRSISPWTWLNENIQCIVPETINGGWYVITTKGIYYTNGYTLEPVFKEQMDASLIGQSLFNSALLPQSADIVGNQLVFWGDGGQLNRNRDGLYLLDLGTRGLSFAPCSNSCQYRVTPGAVFNDSLYRVHTSYETAAPARKYIAFLDTAALQAFVIVPGGTANSNLKVAQGVQLNFGLRSRDDTVEAAFTITATVKLYDFKRLLWNTAETNAVSSSADKIRVNGTTFTAQVGDEVTVLEGQNAGQIRHIQSIANDGLSTEEWTLDSALTGNTENTIRLSVCPFQKISTQTISNAIELRDLYFDAKNRITARKYLIKIVFESSLFLPDLSEVLFLYNDLNKPL